MTTKLTIPQLIEIHMLHQDTFGVLPGFRNPGFLLQIVDRPFHESFGSSDADGLIRQAALYWHGLARSFAFREGNAATAMHAMLTFLLVNGCELEIDEDDLVDAAIQAATWKMELDECEAWIRARCPAEHALKAPSPSLSPMDKPLA
ncbi:MULTISPECIES: type II toxin-antitoxin system death-on-curing family toxin [unclassified Paenibacillus]|uniref:type II toxin-antitoxin system death-on-curing family toxin n=1 Tax=unclassified Paenibacillus TaxID=185978 RepID=UPI000955E5CD|nr:MULTISPECIES: type II toxin-antitoxin system death-on-curing family toxin [unclassified Paenibacillus]ASS68098.1 type II toxin-antitoxin system death-on-curing family toxin [Paenibacillus sp. RUD330]SIR39135.1 death on curing protein [Paenibacillus sp. RU4X]SIR49609.1 death on curing protein [Paenibacillus sp. RU4T]